MTWGFRLSLASPPTLPRCMTLLFTCPEAHVNKTISDIRTRRGGGLHKDLDDDPFFDICQMFPLRTAMTHANAMARKKYETGENKEIHANSYFRLLKSLGFFLPILRYCKKEKQMRIPILDDMLWSCLAIWANINANCNIVPSPCSSTVPSKREPQ